MVGKVSGDETVKDEDNDGDDGDDDDDDDDDDVADEFDDEVALVVGDDQRCVANSSSCKLGCEKSETSD